VAALRRARGEAIDAIVHAEWCEAEARKARIRATELLNTYDRMLEESRALEPSRPKEA
jgi:hypothetical protein